MGKTVTELTREFVTPILTEMDLELVDIEYVKEGKNWFLRVYIDSPTGVDIEECSKVSERLSKQLDKHDPIPQAYFLEVSSPGVEKPLKKKEHFEQAIGKQVHIKTYEPIDGEKVFEGKLVDFKDDVLTVEQKIKQKTSRVMIPYDKVASARLAVLFSSNDDQLR